ncbi:MAG: hypothetical protein ACRD1R_04380 [Acidobacteriota bacterium]
MRRWSQTLALAIASCALGAVWAQDDSSSEDSFAPARQNVLLRLHFERQYHSLQLHPTPERNQFFIERYIDLQIDYFLEKTREQVESVETAQQGLKDSHQSFLELESIATRQAFSSSLKDVEDRANDLRNALAYILLQLDSKGDPSVEVKDATTGFRDEVDYISRQIKSALKQIDTYFFSAQNTVQFADLKGKNMLIQLYRAQQIAKKVREKLHN